MLLPLLNARPMTSRLRNWEQALPGVTTTATSLSNPQPLLRSSEWGFFNVHLQQCIMQVTVVSKRDLSDPMPGTARVYIGRPSALGNPFPMKGESDRETVVRSYQGWLRKQYRSGGKAKQELLRLHQLARKQPLELVCWCAPSLCHADVIKHALMSMEHADWENAGSPYPPVPLPVSPI